MSRVANVYRKLAEVRFDRLRKELTRRLLLLRRNPKTVLECDPQHLRIRLRLTTPPWPSWQPFYFHPRNLLSAITPEQHASRLITAWQRALAGIEE